MTDVGGARLAIINWRDPWHPDAGGAERYAWAIATRFAARGARVSFLTARAPGQRARGRAGGVEIVRMGGKFSVYPLMLARMLLSRRRYDAVIDCHNGIPFFTPWVLPRRVRVVCVVHHVHDWQFGMYFPGWLASIGRFLEGPVARFTYRDRDTVAVSRSTLHALRTRLRWTGPVHIVPNGVTVAAAEPRADLGEPALVSVNRLVPHKRLELVVDLTDRLRARFPGLRAHIVGRGPDSVPLAERIAALGLAEAVTLHGYLDESAKAAVVGGSRLHLCTSKAEGWGLCVIEAAAAGVPTVAYDVDGLRDSIRDGVTGWLVPAGELLEDVVERALKELSDPARRREIAADCRRWAADFDWSRTADRMADVLLGSPAEGS